MKWATLALLALLILISVFFRATSRVAPHFDPDIYHYVAHALGAHKSTPYNNNMESLEESFRRGIAIMEVDLIMTSDRDIVCGHPWVHTELSSPLTRADFDDFNSRRTEPWCTFSDIAAWLELHPQVKVVLDVKKDHFFVYSHIARNNADLIPRLIPQVYHYSEIGLAHEMGFPHVIYTLYKEGGSSVTRQRIINDLAVCGRGYSVAVNPQSAVWGDALASTLAKCGTDFFLYTINSPEDAELYRDKYRATGIYTDFLSP